MERTVLLADSGILTVDKLALPNIDNKYAGQIPKMTLEAAERQLIRQALAESDGNKQKSADFLGITKSSLNRRLEKYALSE